LAKLALALGTLALVFAALELGLRAADYDPLRGLREDDWRELFIRTSKVPLLGYELTPGARGEGWGCETVINRHGFRDRECELEKPAGTLRVVAIGDSITFGNMLPVEDSYPKQLEALLVADGHAVEVLNFGVGGYDVLQSVVMLEQRALAFDPDAVVLGFCVNDLGTVSISRSYIESMERYRSFPYGLRTVQWLGLRRDRLSLQQGFREKNREERFARDNAETIADVSGDSGLAESMRALEALLPADPVPAAQHVFLSWYASAAHLGKVRFAFERLAGVALRRDLPVAVAIIPYLAEGDLVPAYDQAYAMIGREARRAGLDVLELKDVFRAFGPARLRIEARDHVHPDREGHALIARALEAWLADSDLLR